nr:immunoglobulin heavy chain junction region [Mus musculus]
CARSAVPDYW